MYYVSHAKILFFSKSLSVIIICKTRDTHLITHAILTPVIFVSIFVGFSFETLFPLSPSVMTLIFKDVEFSCASFGLSGNFASGCSPTQTPTQMLKKYFWGSVPRKLVWVWYQWKWFSKLDNLSYSDSSFIRWFRKC